jgi:hypothetical protein
MRLDRRTRILRGKRQGAFNRDQLYLDRALRARVGRKVRAHLRRLESVVLITPRWSQAQRFLDDVAVDVAIGTPRVEARLLSLQPLAGRNVHEAWSWLAQAFVEFCSLPSDGPLAHAVNRHGFRHALTSVFRRSTRGPRRALLLHGLEHLHVEARDDVLRCFEDHLDEVGTDRRLTLLFGGSVDTPQFELRGGVKIALPDFGPDEAIEALVEYLGPGERDRIAQVVELVGGVPALLDRLGSEAELGRLAADRDGLWRALGPLAEEVRGAVAIVSAVDGLAERLEEVSREGPLPEDVRWDRMLLRAGLFSAEGRIGRGKVALRAPLFAELAGSR